MRRITPALALVASVALLTGACGGGDTGTAEPTQASEDTGGAEATEEPSVRGDEDLVIWADPVRFEYVQEIANEFGEENGISVGVQGIVAVREDLITANAAGNGPDVVVGAHDWLGQLVQNGTVEPLQITPDALAQYSETAVQAWTYDGQVYAVPYAVESVALYCNTEFAPDTYATLEDVVAAGQAGVDAGQLEVPLILQQGDLGDAYHMQPLFTSAGGYVFGRDAAGSYDPADLGINKPESIAAAQKIATLGSSGANTIRTTISGDNYLSLFTEGKAACMVSGPWSLPDVEKALGENFTVQPVPGFAGMEPAEPFMGSQGFMVASNGKNKAFAQEFVVNAVNNEEAMQQLFELSNQPPAMTTVLEGVTDEKVLAFAAAAEQAAPMPAIPAMNQVFAPLGQAWAAIIGGADPAATMTQTHETIAAAIAAG